MIDRDQLTVGGDAALWKRAYDDYFVTRLQLRYLDPIKVLQDNGAFQGEGFSIAPIQCSLVEFLESTVQGTTYRFLKKGEKPRRYEYSFSSNIFKCFLTTRAPFASEFDEPLAESFYIGVRCALLHEARTREGWRIHAVDTSKPSRIVSPAEKIVYRNGFQDGLLSFIASYGQQLLRDRNYQEAFIRKFNSLCA